jgi:hypothetical protein
LNDNRKAAASVYLHLNLTMIGDKFYMFIKYTILIVLFKISKIITKKLYDIIFNNIWKV